MVVYSFFFLFFFENGSLEHFFHLFESVIFSIKAHIVLLVGQSYSVLKCTWSEQMNESPNLVIATVEWKKVLITLIPLKAKGKPFGTLLTLCVCKKKKKKCILSVCFWQTSTGQYKVIFSVLIAGWLIIGSCFSVWTGYQNWSSCRTQMAPLEQQAWH